MAGQTPKSSFRTVLPNHVKKEAAALMAPEVLGY